MAEDRSPEHELYGYSAKEWQQWLVTDRETGEDHSEYAVPCSRYGYQADGCAWWAVAAQYAYESLGGDTDDPEQSLNYFMGLAVNDNPTVLELVTEAWANLPKSLRLELGGKAVVRELLG